MIVFLLFSLAFTAQLIVSDPGNATSNQAQLAKMVKQLQEAQEQTSELRNMKSNIQKNLDFVQKVNENVKNYERVRKIITNQEKIYNMAFSIKSEFSGSDYLQVILRSENMTNAILEQTKSNINELSKILNSGSFNMNDAERIESIRFYEEETNKQISLLSSQRSILRKYENALKICKANKFSVDDLKK
ncbi:MAG: hypothetical protein LBQ13_04760 [Endomicrobium sp.]|nr:hypothetical protein [Endomicrobium sp.]